MSFTLDTRVPVLFAPASTAGPDDALLLESAAPPPAGRAAGCFVVEGTHPPGCICCAPRRAAGRALAMLLQQRARGETQFFTRIIAVVHTASARADILAALESDPVASACFRLVTTA